MEQMEQMEKEFTETRTMVVLDSQKNVLSTWLGIEDRDSSFWFGQNLFTTPHDSMKHHILLFILQYIHSLPTVSICAVAANTTTINL